MITYPIPYPNLHRFTMVDGPVIRHRQRWPDREGNQLQGLTAGIKWYEEVNAPIPEAGTDFDPATHKLGPLDWVYDDIEETATATHTIVALTQAELDELAKHASMAAEMDQAKAIYQDLKNGVGTAGERMARLEKVTARLLREFIDG